MSSPVNPPRRNPPENHNSRPPDNATPDRPLPTPQPLKSYSSTLSGVLPDQPSSPAWICVGENDITPVISNGVRALRLSQGFKEKLCKPWTNTVVIRLIGKSVGYSYLCNRLRSMWKPSSSMQVIDVDLNCFMVRFGEEKDYFRALTGGPWRVEYENLPELCFSCGKVGHEKGSCPSLLQLVPLPTGPAGAAYVQEPPPKPPSGEMADDGYGPWLTVTRNSRRGKRENIPKKETPQKGKEEESNARSKADGISGKHTFGKSKTSGEGPAPSKSSNEKGKESTHSAFIADKGNSSGSAKGIGKPNSKIIGPEKNSGPSAQASHSPKPPSFGKGPAGPSSSASGPPGPKAPLNSEKLSSPHLGPVAAQPKTLVLPFASFQPTPRSHPPLSSTPARQHFLNNSSSPTTKSLPPIPKSKKTTKKKRVFTKKAKDLIIDQVRMSEKEKADLLAAEKGGGEPIAPATAPIKQNESAEIAEMMIVSPSYEAGMPGQDQVRQPKKEMAVLVAAVTEDGDNPAPVSFSTKPSDSDDMVIEQPSTEAGKPGWDLNNPSSENP
ncbi:hypothetical protein LINPERHAP2_LOCUS13202 [Linum perenne]